jgi:hypothetical protein
MRIAHPRRYRITGYAVPEDGRSSTTAFLSFL